MNQDIIWDHFQNEGVAAFHDADARTEFLVRRLAAGERVLNIGVGAAVLERLAAAKGVEIWCLDPSERAIAKVRETLHLGERAQAGYSQALPFPDEHFDTVIMSEVLEHLEPDILQQSLSEVCRVLKAGGRFLGTVPAREDLSQLMVVCPSCAHQFHRWGHCSSFDEQGLARLLASQFRDARVEEHFFILWDHVGWKGRIAGLIKQFLSWRRVGTYGINRSFAFCAFK